MLERLLQNSYGRRVEARKCADVTGSALHAGQCWCIGLITRKGSRTSRARVPLAAVEAYYAIVRPCRTDASSYTVPVFTYGASLGRSSDICMHIFLGMSLPTNHLLEA